MSKLFHGAKIDSFLKSLSYWQTINLYITLRQANTDISFEDAKTEALTKFGEDDLRYMLEEAISSPNPKHHRQSSKYSIPHSLHQ